MLYIDLDIYIWLSHLLSIRIVNTHSTLIETQILSWIKNFLWKQEIIDGFNNSVLHRYIDLILRIDSCSYRVISGWYIFSLAHIHIAAQSQVFQWTVNSCMLMPILQMMAFPQNERGMVCLQMMHVRKRLIWCWELIIQEVVNFMLIFSYNVQILWFSKYCNISIYFKYKQKYIIKYFYLKMISFRNGVCFS